MTVPTITGTEQCEVSTPRSQVLNYPLLRRHVHRVRNVALRLAQAENIPESSYEVVELAALLHDVNDWKYALTAGHEKFTPEAFLALNKYSRADEVIDIINRMGFKVRDSFFSLSSSV